MLGSLVKRLVGPRVMVGIIIVLVLALGIGGFTLWKQIERAERAKGAAEQWEQTARDNARQVSELKREIQRREKALQHAQQAEVQARHERRELQRRLSAAGDQGSEAYRECRSVGVPDGVVDELRHANGDEDRD